MYRPVALAAGLALVLATARADDAIPPETVDAVKRATVFVRVQGPNWKASGSGFVVSADKDAVLVATNYHVIAAPGFDKRAKPGPVELAKSLKIPTVTAIFDSGTKAEQSVKAEAVAADPDADLAILRITGAKDPPTAIDLAGAPKLSETMTIYSFGYPFGQALAVGKGNPAVTVGKGSVSSLRNDDAGELALVQIDGALNPGNSGGPVVDSKGKLVGVAVAITKSGQGIGFAVPAAEVSKMLKGRLGGVQAVTRFADGKATVRVEVGLIDPAAAIRGVTLHYLVLPLKGVRPEAGTALEKHPEAKKVALKVEGGLASGEVTAAEGGGELLVQATPDGGAGAAGATRVRGISLTAPKVPVPVAPGELRVEANGRGPRIQGGGGGVPEFRELGPEGGLLVGFELGMGRFANLDTIVAVRPVYRVGEKEVFGAQYGTDTSKTVKVIAKPGYAVGSIALQTSIPLIGLSVTFHKVADGKLDPKDTYKSDWVGSTLGPNAVRLGDGSSIVGLLVKATEKDVVGLGFVYPDTAKQDAPWPPGKPTAIHGGGRDEEFRDGAPAGGLLVGLEVGLGKFVNNDVVKAVRPIYRVGDKDSTGTQYGTQLDRVTKIVAKPGYAVGAITVKVGLGLDGLSVTFMKVVDGKLDPKDSYESEWVGGMGGGRPTKLGGDGTPVVGIAGRGNAKDANGLGLLLKDEKK